MDFIKLIPEQMYILIASLYVLGVLLRGNSYTNNEMIPFMLLSVSILFSIFIRGFNVDSIMQGILCTGAAIGINESVKQGLKLRDRGE